MCIETRVCSKSCVCLYLHPSLSTVCSIDLYFFYCVHAWCALHVTPTHTQHTRTYLLQIPSQQRGGGIARIPRTVFLHIPLFRIQKRAATCGWVCFHVYRRATLPHSHQLHHHPNLTSSKYPRSPSPVHHQGAGGGRGRWRRKQRCDDNCPTQHNTNTTRGELDRSV